MSVLVPIFVIACIIVVAVILSSIVSGKGLPREALVAYIVISCSFACIGTFIGICFVFFGM